MRKELLPLWVQPYKKTGYDVRLEKGRYVLYRVTSKRIEGKKYPQLIQDYIGVITEDGLKEKKKDFDINNYYCLEYGLSNFIYKKFIADLKRCLYSKDRGKSKNNIIKLGIINYIYNCVNEDTLKMSYLTFDEYDSLLVLYNKISSNSILRVSNRVSKLLAELIKDDTDRSLLTSYLKFHTCLYNRDDLIVANKSSQLLNLLKKYGVNYE